MDNASRELYWGKAMHSSSAFLASLKDSCFGSNPPGHGGDTFSAV